MPDSGMKIYFITQTDFDVNLDIATWKEMAEALSEEGCKVNILIPSFNGKTKLKKGKAKITYLPYPRIKLISYPVFQLSIFLYTLFSVILGKCNLIIADSYAVPTLIPLALLKKIRLSKVKLVFDIRSIPVDVYGTSGSIQVKRFNASVWIAKWLFDGITVITELYSQKIASDFGLKESSMGIWTSGVSESKFSPLVESDIRDKYSLNNKFVVMYHGGISVSRGIDSLLYALKKLKKEIPDLMLLLLGKGYENEINRIIKQEEIEDMVIFLPPVSYDEVPKYIKACNVGILPFPDNIWWRMSSPLKLFEYLSMGKPVILTDIRAHRAAVGNEEFAFFVSTNSPDDIASGIRKVYNNRSQLQGYGIKGRKAVEEKATWKIQARNLLVYLKTL